MDKNFDAKAAEPRIYAKWEADGCFAAGANTSRDETFCIVIPPPNVTGSLHMGHALNNTLQDVLVRWKRMQGFDTLWQPGTDHAGIATQMVVERELAANGERPRSEMTREAFVERVWEQKRKSEGTILGQLKRLGASCDWSRTRFTMDDGLSAAVLKVFVDLYNKGLIYRGKRLVNWDPKFETAISDLEVENIETDGHMWHFKYPLAVDPATGERATYEYVEKDEDGTVTLRETRDYISIATTRPETMLGDGAVAVHPSDARYAPIVGKLCEIPVGPKEHRRLIPIMSDDYPDPDFGSGAVKITGAHDFNDYGVAKRGNIPCYRLMAMDASLRSDGAPYAEEAAKAQAIVEGKDFTEAEIDAINLVPDEYRGLDRYEARKRVVADISAEGLAVMIPNPEEPPEDDEGRVGFQPTIPLVEAKKIMQPYGDRSKVVIEPMLTDQWFVDAEKLAAPALEAVKDGRTKFVPDNWAKTYFNWMENIEPWCISRQLWWGHQIPVWYGPSVTHFKFEEGAGEGDLWLWKEPVAFCASTFEKALQQAQEHYGECGANCIIYGEEVNDSSASEDLPNEDGKQFVGLWRDPDVLDTWFSSALWPFSTLGWPDKTPELEKYYKTDVLITGNDIIFFWVARMMMQGMEFMDGEVPFDDVYINSIVVDGKGKKMSKSLGNIIDPLDLIDQYGADALRFTLTQQEVQARRMLRLSKEAVEGGRNFGTKLWNAARFAELNECYGDTASVQMPDASHTGAIHEPDGGHTPAIRPPSAHQMVNRWIIGETARCRIAVDKALTDYKFNEAATALYDHVWKVFCDWYLEFSKAHLDGQNTDAKAETQRVFAWALDQCLIMLSPIMPYITEELWNGLASREKPLMTTAWPDLNPADCSDAEADAEMGWVIRVIEAIRSVRAEMNVPAGAKIEMVLTGHSPAVGERLLRNSALIQRLARLSEVAVAEQAPDGSITLALDDCAVNLPLAGVIDVDAEKARLSKALAKAEKEAGGIERKLANEGFLAKAPAEVVEEQRERLTLSKAEGDKLRAALDRLAQL